MAIRSSAPGAWVGAVLFGGGFLLLGVAGWSWQAARAEQAALLSTFAAAPVRAKAAPVAQALAKAEMVAPPPAEKAPTVPVAHAEFQQGEPLFRLRIPRIGVNNIVVWGSSEVALSRAIGS